MIRRAIDGAVIRRAIDGAVVGAFVFVVGACAVLGTARLAFVAWRRGAR